MLVLDYPVFLQDDVQIVGATDCGGYLVKYKNMEGRIGLIWLQDELDNPYPIASKGYAAIKVVKEYLLSLQVSK